MKVRRIKNVSDKRVVVKTKNGIEFSIPPGQDWEDIDVTNLDELGDKVSVKADLTEVGKVSQGGNKVKLYD